MPVNLCGKLAGKAAVVAYAQMNGGPLRVFRRDNYGIFVNRIGRRHVLRHHALQVAELHLLAHHNHLVLRGIEQNHASIHLIQEISSTYRILKRSLTCQKKILKEYGCYNRSLLKA